MRLIVLLCLIFFIITVAIGNISNNYEYIGEEIYLKRNSIEIQNNWKIATFKVINKESSNYEIVKYKASCNNDKILGLVNMFIYDKSSNRLLEKYDTDKGIYPADPSGYANGYLYYNAICKH